MRDSDRDAGGGQGERPAGRGGLDLLRVGLVRRIVLAAWFPVALQVVTLSAFLGLLVVGWNRFAPSGVDETLYARSHMTILVIWALWWPCMIWAMVLVGRAWCAVCPLELVSSVAERTGRRLGIRQRALTGPARAGWVIVLLYAAVHLLVSGVDMERVPAWTARYLASMLGLAALSGLLLRGRAYCRGFCPVALLLSTYGRRGALAVRSRKRTPDGSTSSGDGLAEVVRSCPSLLNPPRLETSKDCVCCGECLKAGGKGGMTVFLRRPFDGTDPREPVASWPITLSVLMISGFVAHELVNKWAAGKAIFLWLPSQAASWAGLPPDNGWVFGVWEIAVFPVLLWTLLGAITCISGGATGIAGAWRAFALPAAVITAAAQMAKGLDKLASWAGYAPGALRDPSGTGTVLAYSAGGRPPPILSLGAVSAIALALLCVALWLAVRELRLAEPWGYVRRTPAIVLLWALYVTIVLGWVV